MSFQQLLFVSGETPAAVVATGGTIYTNGDYKIHAFTTSGNFKVTSINNTSAPFEFYVVGGGNSGTGGSASGAADCGGAGGADGGEGGAYSYSSGTINAFTVNTDYFAEVGSGGNTSSFKGSSAGASGGGSGGAGGSAGYPPQTGFAGTIPASINWISGITTRLGSGGGGGGGGCDDGQGGVYSAGGGLPNGGSGGAPCSDGGNGATGANLYWPGAGPGGGGGGGGCCGFGSAGGTVGPAGDGLVIIRYKFQNV